MEVEISQNTVDEIVSQLSQGFEDHIRMGFLIGREEEDRVIIDGVYVPEQESKPYLAIITGEQKFRAATEIRDSGKFVVGYAQYNGGPIPAFENITIQESIECLARDGIPRVGLVANAKGDYEVFH